MWGTPLANGTKFCKSGYIWATRLSSDILVNQDQAHLVNERISVNNLLKGKAVLERFFLSVAQSKTLVG
jgi:acetylornithine deacetylase/succinyl-diaminopimelate desuccinylase-like protein